MPFDEAGNDQLALQGDDPRRPPHEPSHLAVGSDGHDPAAGDGERFRSGLRLVQRDDLPLPENQIRRLFAGHQHLAAQEGNQKRQWYCDGLNCHGFQLDISLGWHVSERRGLVV